MKRAVVLSICVLFCLALFARHASFEANEVSIEVPIRVLDGNRFVGNLNLDDFEIYDNGKLQQVEALYLFKKTQIFRREEKKLYAPSQQRHFYLFFEISKYTAQIEKGVDSFVQNILSPADNLTLVTPMKTYRMKRKTLESLPKKELSRQIGQILRKDVLSAGAEYRNIIRDIERVAQALAGFPSQNQLDVMRDSVTGGLIELNQDGLMTRYMSLLNILEGIRKVDEEKLLGFARMLAEQEGRKNIFLFYQREYIPLVENRFIERYLSLSRDRPDIAHSLSYLSEFVERDLSFDTERLEKAFLESSVAFHFLYFTESQKRIAGLDLTDSLQDMLESLQRLAEATGGVSETSGDPGLIFQSGVETLENYYLLYYTPLDYVADGNFRSIEVKVIDRDYSLSYRKGYFAVPHEERQ